MQGELDATTKEKRGRKTKEKRERMKGIRGEDRAWRWRWGSPHESLCADQNQP